VEAALKDTTKVRLFAESITNVLPSTECGKPAH